MLRSRCAFCDHANPEGSKFCNECGSPLHLAPCASCEAVNDAGARACHRCGVALVAGESVEQRGAIAATTGERAHVPEALARRVDAPGRSEPGIQLRRPAATIAATSPAVAPSTTAATFAATSSPAAAPGESFVVPPDEMRLAATRDMAAAASRRRTAAAVAVALAIAFAVPLVYFEFFSAHPLADWLHATQADIANAIRARLSPAAPKAAGTTVAAPAAPALTPSAPASVAPTTQSAPSQPAAPAPDNVAPGDEAPREGSSAGNASAPVPPQAPAQPSVQAPAEPSAQAPAQSSAQAPPQPGLDPRAGADAPAAAR